MAGIVDYDRFVHSLRIRGKVDTLHSISLALDRSCVICKNKKKNVIQLVDIGLLQNLHRLPNVERPFGCGFISNEVGLYCTAGEHCEKLGFFRKNV